VKRQLNALANREFLVFVAIVASALTWHVRQHMSDENVQAAPSRVEYGRMCEPSDSAIDNGKARVRPADCDMHTNVRTHRIVRNWV
jgi:hypothetical protein